MKIAVCDDEIEIRCGIERKIRTVYPDIGVLQYSSGNSLLKTELNFAVIFLDIHMDGINGMDTAREIRKRNKNVILIFITAVEEYVFQAFDVGAFHYLVKPIDPVKFYEVLNQAVEYCQDNRHDFLDKEEKSILVKIGGVTEKLYLKDIIFAEVFNRKIELHTVNGILEFYGQLSALEKALGEDFFRPHRAFLINFRYVVRYDACQITLEDGNTIVMARQKYPVFVREYLKYNRRKEVCGGSY